ncbi:hypothetical protein T484DRAFT_3073239 [Baffinella frigidus]|nr:hypothetical protein T484DRAFT_3073239 [Cryptophyta sp. CCMP2293]
MRPSPSVTLIATALIACASLATGYSFAPAALLSLRAPGSALRSDSRHASTCAAARPRGLSALSMLAKAKPAKSAGGGGGFGAPKKAAAAPKKEDADKAPTMLNFDEPEAAKTKGPSGGLKRRLGGSPSKTGVKKTEPKALGLGSRQIGVSTKGEEELWNMVSKIADKPTPEIRLNKEKVPPSSTE